MLSASFHAHAVLHKCFLKTSCHNQQKSRPKLEIANIEEYARWANRVAKGRSGELVLNLLSQ